MMTPLEVSLSIVVVVLVVWVVVQAVMHRREMNESNAAEDMWRDSSERANERLRDVEPREARFRQALGFYADEETWAAPGRQHSEAFKDRGKLARAELAGRSWAQSRADRESSEADLLGYDVRDV